mmetsp:Transcript_7088/g.7968  ORF Transcript_7088/g.7968 Transcript_7088/m.7968 type:complete len:98 (-) Transcript_7088:18-311(-)
MVIHPGYVQTSVSQNALVGDGSEKFGKTDSNIENGLPVEDCVDQMLEGIVLRKADVWISKDNVLKYFLWVGRLFPSIVDFALHHNLTNQKLAMKVAK